MFRKIRISFFVCPFIILILFPMEKLYADLPIKESSICGLKGDIDFKSTAMKPGKFGIPGHTCGQTAAFLDCGSPFSGGCQDCRCGCIKRQCISWEFKNGELSCTKRACIACRVPCSNFEWWMPTAVIESVKRQDDSSWLELPYVKEQLELLESAKEELMRLMPAGTLSKSDRFLNFAGHDSSLNTTKQFSNVHVMWPLFADLFKLMVLSSVAQGYDSLPTQPTLGCIVCATEMSAEQWYGNLFDQTSPLANIIQSMSAACNLMPAPPLPAMTYPYSLTSNIISKLPVTVGKIGLEFTKSGLPPLCLPPPHLGLPFPPSSPCILGWGETVPRVGISRARSWFMGHLLAIGKAGNLVENGAWYPTASFKSGEHFTILYPRGHSGRKIVGANPFILDQGHQVDIANETTLTTVVKWKQTKFCRVAPWMSNEFYEILSNAFCALQPSLLSALKTTQKSTLR